MLQPWYSIFCYVKPWSIWYYLTQCSSYTQYFGYKNDGFHYSVAQPKQAAFLLSATNIDWYQVQRNSVNPTYMGQDRSWIIEYSALSYNTCTDLSSNRQFFVTVPILGLYNQSQEYYIWISPSSAWSASSGVIWSLHIWRSSWCGRHRVKRYHNSRCTDTLGGHFDHAPPPRSDVFFW